MNGLWGAGGPARAGLIASMQTLAAGLRRYSAMPAASWSFIRDYEEEIRRLRARAPSVVRNRSERGTMSWCMGHSFERFVHRRLMPRFIPRTDNLVAPGAEWREAMRREAEADFEARVVVRRFHLDGSRVEGEEPAISAVPRAFRMWLFFNATKNGDYRYVDLRSELGDRLLAGEVSKSDAFREALIFQDVLDHYMRMGDATGTAMHWLFLPLRSNQPCIDSMSLESAEEGPPLLFFNQMKIRPLAHFPKLDETNELVKRIVGDAPVKPLLRLFQPRDGWYADRPHCMFRVFEAAMMCDKKY